VDVSGSEPARGAQRVAGKAEWRAFLLAERGAVPAGQRRLEADALAAAAGELAASVDGSTVCCYLPFGTEPGSFDLVDTLADAGLRVLLPVIPERRGPLLWSVYGGPNALVEGPLRGLLEPSGPRLPPASIGEAALVLVPALAVDAHGVRLGRGAGYYDRSLPLVTPGAELVAVVRDAEFVPQLPAEPHDVRMTGALTPCGGYVRLPM
jgi:5-formyltetrahydrofolate cyclo-ligase